MVATSIRGAQTTATVNTSQHERDVQRRLRYLNPSAAPFTLVLSAQSSVPAENFKFEWAEKGGDHAGAGFAPAWDGINAGGGYTAGDTDMIVDNSEYFRVNDLIKFPRTGEIARVSAVDTSTDTLTVVRSVGTTAAAALVDNDDIVILGTAFAEGADVGSPHDFQESWKYNYTEIKRTAFGASRTQQQTANYLGNNRKRQAMEAGIRHKIDLERAFLFGERERDTTVTTAPRNVTGGVLYFATENNVSMGTLTEAEVWASCANVFAHTAGSDARTLYGSGLVISTIDLLAGARLQTVPSDKTYGIAVNQWITSHGRLNIVKHRLLEDGTTASGTTDGWGGHALLLDMSQLKYRPMQNTQLLKNRQGNGIDGYVDEYLTECGLEFSNPKLHGVWTGVTG